MPKTKAPRTRPRSPSGSPTPRARRSRGDVPPSPATPSTRTSTRVPKATNLAMDFIKTTAARRATAAAEADALAVEADASSSASTKTPAASTKDASGVSHDTSTSVKNALTSVKKASTSIKKTSTSVKNVSAPTKDALASKKHTSSSAANGGKKGPTSSKNPSAFEDVSTLSGVNGLAVDDAADNKGPEATNGMRLRSRGKPAAPAANQKLPKASKKARVAKDVQDETTSGETIPTAEHPDHPTTPITAVRVRAEDGDAALEAPAPVKPKPKPRAVRREHDTTAALQQDIPVPQPEHLDQHDAGQPDVSDSGMHAGGSNRSLPVAPEVLGGQVTVEGSGVDRSPVAAHSVLRIGLNAAEHRPDLRSQGMAVVPLGMTAVVGPSSVVPRASSSLREAAPARLEDLRELASGVAHVERRIPVDRPADVSHPGMTHVEQLDPPQVWQRDMQNVGWEVRPHVWHGDLQNLPPNLQPDVAPHVQREDLQIPYADVPPHVPPHVSRQVSPNLPPDVPQNIPPHVSQQVPPHNPYDIPPQGPPNVSHNLGQDVRHGAPYIVPNAIPPQGPYVLPPYARSGPTVQAAARGPYPAHHAAPNQHPDSNGSGTGVPHLTHPYPGMPRDAADAHPRLREDHSAPPWRLRQGALYLQEEQSSSSTHLMDMQQDVGMNVVAHVTPKAVPDTQADMHMYVSPDDRTHVSDDGPMEVYPDNVAPGAHDTLAEAHEQSHMAHIQADGGVPEYAHTEIRDDVSMNPHPDVRDHVPMDARPDVRDHIRTAARPDVSDHVPMDARPDVRDHVLTDVHPDVHDHVRTAVRPDVSDHVPMDARPDVRDHVLTDVRPDVRDHVPMDARPDVRGHVRTAARPDVRDHVPMNARPDVVRPDVRHHVHTDAHEHAAMHIHADVLESAPLDEHADVTNDVPMGDSAEDHTQLHAKVPTKADAAKGKSRNEHTLRSRKAQEAATAANHKRGTSSTVAPNDGTDENLSEAAYNSGDGEDEGEGNGDSDADEEGAGDDDGEGDGDGDGDQNGDSDSDGAGEDEVDDSDSDTERDAIFGDTKAVGRISKANKEIINASFDDVVEVARKASELTGLSVGQVYDQWNVKRTRHNVRNNTWNSYQGYHRANLAQERARLSKAVLKRSKESDIPSLCYKEFKKKYGKKAYDILESWRQLQELSGAANTTVARRKQDWNSWSSDMKQKAKVGHLKHGFSCLILAVGNVINSDSSLAMIHASKDAQGFFPTRFRCDDDTAIGHMKALVYNNVSLAVVEMSQNDDAGPSNPTSLMPLGGPVGPKTVNVAQDLFIAMLQTLKLPNSRGRSQFLVSCMRGLLRVLGPQGAVLADISNFQWKKFGAMLAAQGVQMIGYPERVPMPPAADADDKPTRSKGLSGIGATASQLFMDAFLKPHKTHPIGFQLYSGLRTDLLNSKVPVIIGVPPHPTSDFTHGRRFFVNGVTDRAGLKRRLPSADDSDDEAPVLSKKRRAAPLDSGDDDDEAPVPSKKHRVAAPPDSGDDADEEEVERSDKMATKRASPRRTCSKTDQAKSAQSKTVRHGKADNEQPGKSKTVDPAKVAKIAKAAGITLRTVAVEIPDTPSAPIARQHTQKAEEKGEDAMTISSGTGSRYTPSRSATPGPSQSRGSLKCKADALQSAEEESVSETLSDILAAAATIAKGKQRAVDVGARAFETSDDEDTVASASLTALENVRENGHEDNHKADESAVLAPVRQQTRQSAVEADVGTDVGQSVQQASHADVAAEAEQHISQTSHTDVPANVGQHVSQASHADGSADVRRHVGQRVVLAGRPDVPTNVGQQVRTEVPPHVGTDVGQRVTHANPPYGGWDVGQHVQAAGNANTRPNVQPHHAVHVPPDVGMNATPGSMPPFPPNLRHAPPNSLPPFPPNLRHAPPNSLPPFPPNVGPHAIPQSSVHVNQHVSGGPFGGIHNPEAQRVPVNHPQDNPQVGGAPHGGASSSAGASYGAYTQAPYAPPFGSYPPHPGYSNHPYMNAAAYQNPNGGRPGGFHPAMHTGLSYQQQYFQPPPAPPPGSSMSTSPPPAYQPAQSATPGAYPHPGYQHTNTAPGASHQYQEGRHA